jgi:O-methyltransferase involved in polyketide biosynthesis
VPNTAGVDYDAAREKMRAATEKWREHGFALDFAELGFEGERNEVGEYLDARGWQSMGTRMSELMAANGFPAMPQPDDDQPTMNGVIYYTSKLG